jgi:hypothetical protein
MQRPCLEGRLASDLSRLYSLRKLDLYQQSFQGQLPPEWAASGALPSLDFLRLSFNKLSGELRLPACNQLCCIDDFMVLLSSAATFAHSVHGVGITWACSSPCVPSTCQAAPVHLRCSSRMHSQSQSRTPLLGRSDA